MFVFNVLKLYVSQIKKNNNNNNPPNLQIRKCLNDFLLFFLFQHNDLCFFLHLITLLLSLHRWPKPIITPILLIHAPPMLFLHLQIF